MTAAFAVLLLCVPRNPYREQRVTQFESTHAVQTEPGERQACQQPPTSTPGQRSACHRSAPGNRSYGLVSPLKLAVLFHRGNLARQPIQQRRQSRNELKASNSSTDQLPVPFRQSPRPPKQQ